MDEDDNGKFRPEKVNPYPAVDDYCCFYPVLLVNQITVSENKCVLKHQNLQMFDLKLNKYAQF